MKVAEIISEDLTRRDFLRGAGAVAATAATGAQAGTYKNMVDFGMQKFAQESTKLEKRIPPIFQNLLAASGKDANLLRNVKVSASSTPAAAEVFGDGSIILDVSTYYDLSDDAIAYTLAHEMGHVVYGHHGGYKGLSAEQAKQRELSADVYGAKLAYKCGYNPKEAFADMNAAEKRARSKSTDTHPDYQTRKGHVQKQTGIPVATINNLQHNKMAIRNFMMA